MKLSIITINYNNKEGLQRTIDSVICQTWRDFEWIIIDGGSTDGSKELIEQYQNHFSYWCSEPDKGVYNAMNKGISKAKGEYLNFMNSGDVFHESSTLEKVFHEKLFGDIVYGDCILIRDGKGQLWSFPHHVNLDFFYSDNICHQAMFIKNFVLKKKGYDENYRIYGDWARWINVAYDGGEFQYIPHIICEYEFGGLSSQSLDNKEKEYEKMVRSLPVSVSHSFLVKSFKEREILQMYKREILQMYNDSNIVRDTLSLSKERYLYFQLIRLNLIIVKILRKVLKTFNSYI